MKKHKINGIEHTDRIKGSITMKFLQDPDESRNINKMRNKKFVTKREAIMIADVVKRGMSVEVMNDLKELKASRSKSLKAA